jgi:hypothetical protein
MSDLIKGFFSFSVFGVLIAACYLWVLFSRRSFLSKGLGPLVPLVNGTLHYEQTRVTLRGTYQGFPVWVIHTLGGQDFPDLFTLETEVPGKSDWVLGYGNEKLLARDRWYFKTGDEFLKARLEESGLLAKMEGWKSRPTIQFKAHEGKLNYTEDGYPPAAERFKQQLDLLTWLCKLNLRMNSR